MAWRIGRAALVAWCLVAAAASRAAAQTPPPDDKPSMEIYGFAQADAIVDFKQNNPMLTSTGRRGCPTSQPVRRAATSTRAPVRAGSVSKARSRRRAAT
jgi:hypothetical protein